MINDKFASNPVVDVPIRDNVIVPCPKSGRQKKTFAARHCPSCEFFQGVGQLKHPKDQEESKQIEEGIQNGTIPWSEAYCVRCYVVIEWRCEDID